MSGTGGGSGNGEDGSPIMTFGKYKGKTFKEVATSHPEYCAWAKKQGKPSGQLGEFLKWFDENNAQTSSVPTAGASSGPVGASASTAGAAASSNPSSSSGTGSALGKRKWTPPEPAPGQMFMFVKVGNVGSVGGGSDGNLSVSVDATFADLRKAVIELVQTPAYLDKAYQARLCAISVLSNQEQPLKMKGEPQPEDAKLKDSGFEPGTTDFAAWCVPGAEKRPVVEWTVFEPEISPEGIAEAEAAADVPSEVETDDVKCIGKCGFFGRRSGFCSKCWTAATKEQRIFYSFAFSKMKAGREEALALLEKAEEKRKEERSKVARQEAEEARKRDAEREELARQNEERRARGECHRADTSRLGHNWYIWSREDFGEGGCPVSFQTWTCGLRLREHAQEAPCEHGSWEAMHELVEKLKTQVKHATERTEGDEAWSAFWVSRQQQESEGVAEADPLPTRLRKVLRLPDSVPWAEQEVVGWGRACFWSREQYRSNANLAKLKQATAAMKAACVKDSVWQLSFDPDEQGPCYPVFIAGLTKDSGHLLCTWAQRTWT